MDACDLLKLISPSAAYMHQWTGFALVQIMGCRLFGTKPLPESTLIFVNWTLMNKLQWNLNQIHFINQNAFENVVCEMAAILFWKRWVKPNITVHGTFWLPQCQWSRHEGYGSHYCDAIMGAMASQITSLTNVYSIVHSGADQRKYQGPRHWPLCGEFTGDRWIPRTNGE